LTPNLVPSLVLTDHSYSELFHNNDLPFHPLESPGNTIITTIACGKALIATETSGL
jgi:hypothetical protein